MSRTKRIDVFNGYVKTCRDGKTYNYRKQAPWHWRNPMMVRPKRAKTKTMCTKVLKGYDSENMAFPLGNHKPHIYYW